MKNTILIFSLLLSLLSCKAQDVINITDGIEAGKYSKDINDVRSNFAGTWKWTNGNKEFTLYIYKADMIDDKVISGQFYIDKIFGYYVYKENGIEILNTSSHFNGGVTIEKIKTAPFIAITHNGENTRIASLTDFGKEYINYNCETQYKSTSLDFNIIDINSNVLEANIKFVNTEIVRVGNENCSTQPQDGFTMPSEMSLTKTSNTAPNL